MAAYGDVVDAAVGHLVNIYIYGGTYEIEKYEWVSMERKFLFSGPSLYVPWITHMFFVDLNDNFFYAKKTKRNCEEV